jgi:hypothetical protein
MDETQECLTPEAPPESLEYIAFVGYLLPLTDAEALATAMDAQTTWDRFERVELIGGLCLQEYVRPVSAGRDEVPNTSPDQMNIWVAPERYTQHLADYAALDWRINRVDVQDDGAYGVIWDSPRLRAIGEVLEAAAREYVAPPSYVDTSYAPAGYASSGYVAPTPSWQPTVQSGMRAGAMAGFLDGITGGGGFFDFDF